MVEEDEGGEENMVWYTRERYLVEGCNDVFGRGGARHAGSKL